MADVTLYLDPGLATGNDDGSTAANAFKTFASCVAYLNTNHADMVTATQSVDVIWLSTSGGISSSTNVTHTLTVNCSETYPLRFVGDPDTVTPGIWDTTKPTLEWSPTSSSYPQHINFAGTSLSVYVEFVNLNFLWNSTYNGSTQSKFFENTTAKAAGSKMVFTGCMFKGGVNTGTASKVYIRCSSTNMVATVNNCIAFDQTHSGTGVAIFLYNTRPLSEGVCVIANCSVKNVSQLVTDTSSSNVAVVNSMLIDVTDPSMLGSHAATGYNSTNAASGATNYPLPGSNNTHSEAADFVSSTDFHLNSANGLGAGTGVATYGAYVPATDIDGDSRGTATTDTGADLFTASGPSTTEDSAVVTDSAEGIVTRPRGAQDELAISDLTDTVSIRPRVTLDTLSVIDSLVSSGVSVNVVTTLDELIVFDALASAAITLPDEVELTDAAIAKVLRPRVATDDAAVTDAALAGGQSVTTLTTTDAVTVDDATMLAVRRVQAVLDTVAVTDLDSAFKTRLVEAADSVDVRDDYVALRYNRRTLLDLVDVSDNAVSGLSTVEAVVVSDSLSVADSATGTRIFVEPSKIFILVGLSKEPIDVGIED